MQSVILFTTVDSIRASVGLDAADVPDDLIQAQNLGMQFTLDLGTWYPGDYQADWIASGLNPAAPIGDDIVNITPAQRRGYMLSVYSMWFGAYAVIQTLLAIPQRISDGKDEIQRFQGINLEKMLARVKQNVDGVKDVILAEVNPPGVSVAAGLGATLVSPESYDPVTGQ